MRKFLKNSILFLLTWFIVHEGVILIDGYSDGRVQSEYIVVFGNTVHENGQLSKRLKARVDEGFNLYQANYAPKIIVSGGLGKEGFYEGDRMANYLLSRGVPVEDIIVDNLGVTTQATASNFANQFPDANSVVLVSQFYHISRAKLAFKKAGVEQVNGVHCKYHESRDFYSLFREFFGYYSYLMK